MPEKEVNGGSEIAQIMICSFCSNLVSVQQSGHSTFVLDIGLFSNSVVSFLAVENFF